MNGAGVSDGDLVDAVRAGDGDAFGLLYTRHQPAIYGYCYRAMGNADDAADLTQEVFVKALAAMRRSDAALNLSPWLYRIATNVCLDVHRRRMRHRWLPWEDAKHDHLLQAGDGQPLRIVERDEVCILVLATLHRMRPRHCHALIMRDHGMGCGEIGERLGISRSATKAMLFRARDEFRRIYLDLEARRLPAAGYGSAAH